MGAWEAFRSPDPTRVCALLRQDTSSLPFLAGALLRHLQQFPSVENGLSRSEAQALEEISSGTSVLREWYVASHGEREDPVFLGDAVYAWYLEGLSDAREPRLVLEGGGVITAPRGPDDASRFWMGEGRVTERGRAVLDGREDRIRLNGIDRWLGGHLGGGEAVWRWDETARQPRRVA